MSRQAYLRYERERDLEAVDPVPLEGAQLHYAADAMRVAVGDYLAQFEGMEDDDGLDFPDESEAWTDDEADVLTVHQLRDAAAEDRLSSPEAGPVDSNSESQPEGRPEPPPPPASESEDVSPQ